jgi:ATP-dependent 26S proteasome regulatory subunit
VLVLEDCAEMLAPDARRDVGQALSRLLNACDGLIGRGLRLLILITTNEPLEKVHPAIARPGRCAARIEFERFMPPSAAEWLEVHGSPLTHRLDGAVTLADLYAMRDGHRSENGRRPVGFAA